MIGKKLYLFFFFLSISFLGISQTVATKLEMKLESAIEKTFDKSDIAMQEISMGFTDDEYIDGTLYALNSGGIKSGYAFLSEAESMKNVFDFVVIISPAMEILNVKVLIYREMHGKQIGTKRWLSQFIGKSIDNQFGFKENIDGISGATISSRNMTVAMDQVMRLFRKLHEKQII